MRMESTRLSSRAAISRTHVTCSIASASVCLLGVLLTGCVSPVPFTHAANASSARLRYRTTTSPGYTSTLYRMNLDSCPQKVIVELVARSDSDPAKAETTSSQAIPGGVPFVFNVGAQRYGSASCANAGAFLPAPGEEYELHLVMAGETSVCIVEIHRLGRSATGEPLRARDASANFFHEPNRLTDYCTKGTR
jgi:hypothetical protein